MPDTEVPKKTTKQRTHAVESSQSLHPIAMLYDGRMRNYHRKDLISGGKAFLMWPTKCNKFTLITALIDFNIPIYSWK